MSIKVLLADDQQLVRAGYQLILESVAPEFTVVGAAADGVEAVEMARKLRPDVCLFDIRMPRMDGIEATRLLAGPGVADPMAVVIVTTFDLDDYVFRSLQAGARGFLLKDIEPSLLLESVRTAATGDALISPKTTARLLARFAAGPLGLTGPGRRHSGQGATTDTQTTLTEREEETLLLVAQGMTNKEIVDQLHLSLSTVKTHISALMQKLAVRNRVELAIWAYQTGRIDSGTE